MPLKVVDDRTIEFTGSAYQILSLYDRLINSEDIKVEANMKREDIVNKWIEDPVQRFIMEKGTCVWKDVSSYTIQFRKLD
jgi:hypothetical protein